MDDEDFGPALLVVPGDCEFTGVCQRCDEVLRTIRPNQSLDVLGEAWDRHVNVEGCHGRVE